VTWSRGELQQAHDHYVAVAKDCASRGEWSAWADLFTDDAVYVDHCFGKFNGRREILDWITATMAEWPNREMTSFPHDWCLCDTDRGWWVCRVLNRMADPGDGRTYEEGNLTVLHYAGGGRFSYEENAYNPANFGPMITAWGTARKAAIAAREAAGGAAAREAAGGAAARVSAE